MQFVPTSSSQTLGIGVSRALSVPVPEEGAAPPVA